MVESAGQWGITSGGLSASGTDSAQVGAITMTCFCGKDMECIEEHPQPWGYMAKRWLCACGKEMWTARTFSKEEKNEYGIHKQESTTQTTQG